MDADPAVSADLVLVALDAPRSHPPPALPCHVTRDGPPQVGQVRSTLERTKSFFPKRRSVGPEPGRTLFFRIERTGRPAAVRPVSIPFFGSLSTSPTLPRLRADGQTRVRPPLLYNPRQPSLVSLCATTESIHRIFVVSRPYR